MEVTPQEGDWDIDACQKLQQEDAPREKWAKILLRMKGNIPEVKLQPRRYPHQTREELCTKAHDRREEKQKKQQEQEEKETTAETWGRDVQQDRQQTRQTAAEEKQQKTTTSGRR